eukprot:6419316-Amphidinium_carterae.1
MLRKVEVARNQLSSCESERNNAKNQLSVMIDTLEKQKQRHAEMIEEHEQHKRNLEVPPRSVHASQNFKIKYDVCF